MRRWAGLVSQGTGVGIPQERILSLEREREETDNCALSVPAGQCAHTQCRPVSVRTLCVWAVPGTLHLLRKRIRSECPERGRTPGADTGWYIPP
ncbi:hypothetical protein chiPu_0032348 [Chiloscyllium punctatum]|uniref:Uncharacterized protein n=1 Tax=Chiloscyllium punctatum TaxID=137246 RepID=A0A401U001_CHIPU|nr:hypothetical protein [Chiloscyllium punctatum]